MPLLNNQQRSEVVKKIGVKLFKTCKNINIYYICKKSNWIFTWNRFLNNNLIKEFIKYIYFTYKIEKIDKSVQRVHFQK